MNRTRKTRSRSNTRKTNRTRSRTRSRTRLQNTRGESCSSDNWQACCPHNKPKVVNGMPQYMATNEINTLLYDGLRWKLKTCCSMCHESMRAQIQANESNFRKMYSAKITGTGKARKLLLKNQHDVKRIGSRAKYVQKLPLVQ